MKAVKKKFNFSILCSVLAAVVVFSCFAVGLTVFGDQFIKDKRAKADALLNAYKSNIEGTLDYEYNYARSLRKILYAKDYDDSDFEKYVSDYFAVEGVEYIALTEIAEGSAMNGSAKTKEVVKKLYTPNGSQTAGQSVEDLDYAYRLARYSGASVKEGPVDDVLCGQEVFLIVEPMFRSTGDGKEEYVGLISVAVRSDVVYKSFHLESLSDSGYNFLFWKLVSGQKERLFGSDEDAEFSTAREIKFNMPSIYTLSIVPVGGWGVDYDYGIKYTFAALISVLTGLALFFLLTAIDRIKRYDALSYVDTATGLYNKAGLLRRMDADHKKSGAKHSVIYCVLSDLSHLLTLAGDEETNVYLEHIVSVFDNYIVAPHAAARISSDSFAVAIAEELSEKELQNIARGLSIELFRKIEVGSINLFPVAEYGYAVSDQAQNAAAQLKAAIDSYEKHRLEISPIVDLKQKCDRMTRGDEDILRDEYTDISVNELAKSVFSYYRKTQRLIYIDALTERGNRMKFERDFERQVKSHPDTPFKAVFVRMVEPNVCDPDVTESVVDEARKETAKALSEQFGRFVYRLDGDLFAGIDVASTGDEDRKALQERLNQVVLLKGEMREIRAELGYAYYPANGSTAEELILNADFSAPREKASAQTADAKDSASDPDKTQNGGGQPQ